MKQKNGFRNLVILFMCLHFSVFLIYPIFKALVGSFHDWNPLTGRFSFIGLENYKYILSDRLFWSSLLNTLTFTFFTVLFRIVIGLTIALFLYSKTIKFKDLFQGIFYMPTITPMVAISFVWMWMFDPQFGLINKLLGIDINWLKDSRFALLAVIIMTIWKDFGYATVLFLGGLMALPTEVFEAASIDGANNIDEFRYITIPLLKPMTIFIVITSLISYLQTYIQVLIMTQGGPGTSTYVISYLIYDEAFVNYEFGIASAMAMILFVIIGVLTYIMFKVIDNEN